MRLVAPAWRWRRAGDFSDFDTVQNAGETPAPRKPAIF
jgi:hypothetical protein